MAYLIDPTARTILAVDLDNVPSGMFDGKEALLMNADTGDVVFESAQGEGYSIVEGIRKPLHGNLLIVGTTEDGENCDPCVSLEWLIEHVDFGTASNDMFFGDRNVRALQ